MPTDPQGLLGQSMLWPLGFLIPSFDHVVWCVSLLFRTGSSLGGALW
jgi:hypothetical protein